MFDESPLIEVPQLHDAVTSRTADVPVLLDVRFSPQPGSDGRSDFAEGHIPGAVYIDLPTELAGQPGEGGAGGRHPMPSAAVFESAMRNAGVSAEQPVVCYDAGDGIAAARCWWLLRYFGHHDVRVLNGGLSSWIAAGHTTEQGLTEVTPGSFRAGESALRMLSAEDVGAFARRGALFDARPAERYRGENEAMDAVSGHIPGAGNLPAVNNLTADGRMLPPDLLREVLGEHPDGDIAVYCGSGVQASHLALAFSAAGISHDVAVYVGSFSDWISDPTRPVSR